MKKTDQTIIIALKIVCSSVGPQTGETLTYPPQGIRSPSAPTMHIDACEHGSWLGGHNEFTAPSFEG